MNYIIGYKIFEFKENEKNTPTLYSDDDMIVKVSKTFDSTKKQNKDTRWCSSQKDSFYRHNKTANMYRITFSDGYKLRLTWDYIDEEASELGSYSGGTHWGQGGIVYGDKKFYDVFRPRDTNDPFEIDWRSNKEREIVDRIKSIPDDAKLSMMEYQDKMSIEKSAIITKSIKDIELIKVIDVKENKSRSIYDYEITVEYRGKEYDIAASKDFKICDLKKLEKDFKNQYSFVGNTINIYLRDKVKEYLKKNKVLESNSFREMKYSDIINDIKDILWPISEMGYDIKPKVEKDKDTDRIYIRINSNEGYSNLDKPIVWTKEVESEFDRLKDFIFECGFLMSEVRYVLEEEPIDKFFGLTYSSFTGLVSNKGIKRLMFILKRITK